MIRVPATKKIKRLEIRSADPECNPYIAFALIIYAALDGIENNLVPPAPVEENLFANASKNDIKVLPDTLDLAKKIADESEFVKKVLKY